MKKHSISAIVAAGHSVVRAPRGVVFARPRADATDPKLLVEQIQAAWTEFKATQEGQVAGKAEAAEVTAKFETINADLNKLTAALEKAQAELAQAKLGGGGAGKALTPEAAAHSKAFSTWFRKGSDPANMRELEVNAALTTQSDPDGGYLVPEEMETTIDRVLTNVSAVRGLSRVINVSGSEYKKLVNVGGADGGWVGEEDARPDTATSKLREILINTAELYANPASTQTALDDSRLDVAQWLADEVSIVFAEKEGAAFVAGDGVKKPRGFLSYPTVENASYAWGSIGFKVTGNATGFIATTTTANPADALMDLYYSLRAAYRNGASWLTSDATMGTIRKFKDGMGNYLWAPPTGPDMPTTILGKPVAFDDHMPAVGAGAFPVAFGNFQRAYLIADRFGVRVLRDPFTSKPNVHFYTTKRVGGGVVNFEAMKLLKVST